MTGRVVPERPSNGAPWTGRGIHADSLDYVHYRQTQTQKEQKEVVHEGNDES